MSRIAPYPPESEILKHSSTQFNRAHQSCARNLLMDLSLKIVIHLRSCEFWLNSIILHLSALSFYQPIDSQHHFIWFLHGYTALFQFLCLLRQQATCSTSTIFILTQTDISHTQSNGLECSHQRIFPGTCVRTDNNLATDPKHATTGFLHHIQELDLPILSNLHAPKSIKNSAQNLIFTMPA